MARSKQRAKTRGTPRLNAQTYTAAQCREADRLATTRLGIPSLLLMENASRSVAEIAIRSMKRLGLTSTRSPSVWIYCGTGNNGGDGLAIARHLHHAGWTVTVRLAGPVSRFKGDALINLTIARKMGLISARQAQTPRPSNLPALVIDALLGTGLTSDVRPALARLIEEVNALRDRGSRILSVDVPSGLDADSGVVRGACVRAHETVTLMGLKPGLLTPTGRSMAGRVTVGDIGMPREILQTILKRKA